MMLTDLADACRKSGLKVEEVSGWRQRGHGSFVKVQTVVCHHTAGPSSGNMPSLGVVTHGRAGLAGPLCNLGLGRDGTVFVVAAGYAWHAGVVLASSYANDHSIGIEAEAVGVGNCWSATQKSAYARLCAALCSHYGLRVDRVLGHKEVCSPHGRKIDPNFDMAAFRTDVSAVLRKHPSTTTRDDDMTPDQLASAPISMLTGPNDVEKKTTLQNVLRDLEGTQDKHGRELAAQSRQLDRIEALLATPPKS